MQQDTHSHGINMSALGRDKQSLSLAQETVAIEVPGLSLYYGEKQALFDVSMNIPKQRVTAFIGPSGCGKSTLLRTFNRMNDLVDGCRVEGAINLYGTNIYRKGEDVAELRRRVGMVIPCHRRSYQRAASPFEEPVPRRQTENRAGIRR